MSLAYTLLGFLNRYQMSGYDLKNLFNNSVSFFWAAQTSQIYRELNALENKGYIRSKIEPSDKGPERRVYSISDKGIEAFQEWMVNPPDQINEDFRNAFLVRVFFSSYVETEVIFSQIKGRLDAYKKEYSALKSVEKELGENPQLSGAEEDRFYRQIVLNRGLYVTEANIRWAEDAIKSIEQKRSRKKAK
jgi:PadR family transcriptional regulator, regulatory protein AphA